MTEKRTLLTVREFALLAGCSEAAVYKRIRLGQLAASEVSEPGKNYTQYMLYESDLAGFTRSPRKSRRTITVSPALSKVIDTHLQSYGNISRLLEDGAWLVLYLNDKVDLSTAVENVSAENAALLVALSGELGGK